MGGHLTCNCKMDVSNSCIIIGKCECDFVSLTIIPMKCYHLVEITLRMDYGIYLIITSKFIKFSSLMELLKYDLNSKLLKQ